MAGDDSAAFAVSPGAELRDAHRALWAHLRTPGSWWTGSQRLALAAESRAAENCPLCRSRREALSPNTVTGRHLSGERLDDAAVEVAHRLRTDPGRLSRAWYERLRADGLDEGAYVEAVAVVAMTAGADAFARALGVAPFALPEPRAGEPSRYRPATARPHGAWVATVAAADADGSEADLYGGAPLAPNIASALSLVPDEARMLARLGAAHYLPIEHVPDPTFRRGALDRPQMELVAARVSALNQCFY